MRVCLYDANANPVVITHDVGEVLRRVHELVVEAVDDGLGAGVRVGGEADVLSSALPTRLHAGDRGDQVGTVRQAVRVAHATRPVQRHPGQAGIGLQAATALGPACAVEEIEEALLCRRGVDGSRRRSGGECEKRPNTTESAEKG
jgi:hypothetical protein